MDRLIGRLLHQIRLPLVLVLAEGVILLLLLEHLEAVAPHMPNGDPRRLGIFVRDLGQLLAPLLVQFRNAQADGLTFCVWGQSEVRGTDALLDRMHQRAVPHLHGEEPRFRHAHGCDLIERHVAAVSLNLHVVDQPRGRAAGPQPAKLLLQNCDRALHAALQLVQTVRGCCHDLPPGGWSPCRCRLSRRRWRGPCRPARLQSHPARGSRTQ